MTKLIALPADAAPTLDDLVYMINAPGTVPVDRKVTLSALAAPLVTPLAAPIAALAAADAAFTGLYIRAGSQSNPSVDNTVVGSGGMSNPVADTIAGFTAGSNITNPNKLFMGALSGFAYYDGTEQPGCGSLQGGSGEAYVALTGTVTKVILGWEDIAFAVGATTYPSVIGGQATAGVGPAATVTSLVGFQIRGPLATSGSPTVTTAKSLNVQEPTVGTNRYSIFAPGRSRFIKGVPSNALEISNASDLLQWASDGTLIKGYASDGASARLTFDPTDAATTRIKVASATGSPHQFSGFNGATENFRVEVDGRVVWFTANQQTTVGAAGAASALPATPTKYLKVKSDSGTALVIPAYLAA